MKVRVKGSGHIWWLKTKAAFNSSKTNVVAINDPFVHLIYILQYDSTHNKFHNRLKDENGEFVVNGKAISIFQERVPTNINKVMLI